MTTEHEIRQRQAELLAFINSPLNKVELKCWHCNTLVPALEGVTPSSFEREAYHPYCYIQRVNESGNGVGVRPLSEEDLLNVTTYRLDKRAKRI